MHGYGSNEEDLHSLAEYLPKKYMVISPRAPISMGDKMNAWYTIDRSSGKVKSNTNDTENATKLIIDFIEYVKYTYKSDNIHIGGFSQGGIMSYSVGLMRPDLVKAIIPMSGRLLDEVKAHVVVSKLKSLKIFITHGTEDKMISIDEANKSVEYLKSIGLSPSYKTYKDGHTITGEMLRDIIEFLNQ
jgi:phospholipase/carboxylesterase